MYPIDCLTDIDKETINEYLKYNGFVLSNLDNLLLNWNKNKLTLFKAFGKQLRYSVPIETKVRNDYLKQKLVEYYTYPKNIYDYINEGFSYNDVRKMMLGSPHSVIKDYKINNAFIIDTFYFFINGNFPSINYRNFLFLLDYNYVFNNYLNISFPLIFTKDGKKDLVIKGGIKTMRAIRKVLEYFDYKNLYLFEEWRDKVSTIRTTTHTISNLTFSIHPIDFITLSDNNSNWSSCLNWRSKGCYSNGTLELLNSNIAIVCYIENPNTEFFIGNNSKYIIPNKMWRTIGYIHKKILVIGKNYPFSDDNISQQCLKYLEKMVYKTLKWKYKYHNQEYRDMYYFEDDNDLHHGGMEEIKYMIDNYDKACKGHHIYLGGENVYNDLAADPIGKYYCSRNWVKENLFLNISGKCTCLVCGNPIYDYGNSKVCNECYNKYECDICSEINTGIEHFYITTLNPEPRHNWDYDEYYSDIDNLHGYEYCKHKMCKKCLDKHIKNEDFLIFKDKDKILLLNKRDLKNSWHYNPKIEFWNVNWTRFELYYIKFHLLKNNFFSIEKYLNKKEQEEFVDDLITFFNSHYEPLTWDNMNKVSEWIRTK